MIIFTCLIPLPQTQGFSRPGQADNCWCLSLCFGLNRDFFFHAASVDAPIERKRYYSFEVSKYSWGLLHLAFSGGHLGGISRLRNGIRLLNNKEGLAKVQLWLQLLFPESIYITSIFSSKKKHFPYKLGICWHVALTCQFRSEIKHNKNRKLLCAGKNKKQTQGVSYFQNMAESSVKGICSPSCMRVRMSEFVFKEGINLASCTLACFLAQKPDLWTVSEEPPGTHELTA